MREPIRFPKAGELRRVPVDIRAHDEVVFEAGGSTEVPVRILSRANTSLLKWLPANMARCQAAFGSGAVLFRGFAPMPPEELQRVQHILTEQPLEYTERSSPRTQVLNNVYTSTEYPAHQEIFFHNENSYQNNWPRVLMFYADRVAESGGQTPIVDVRRVLSRIPSELVAEFQRRKIMYVRNFGSGIGLSWQTVFQTDDRLRVAAYCADHGIQVEWLERDRLRTRTVREATAIHPDTGEKIWFNHAAFFHISTLGSELSAGLLAQCGEENLPNHVYFGDGAPISEPSIELVRRAYREPAITFDWRVGDLLLLDNMLFAHGRSRFTGERRVYVGMAAGFARFQSTV